MRVEGIFNSKHNDARVDYLTFGDGCGNEINISWDSSDWWDEDDGSRHFYCKGVYFDDEYANGQIDRLENMSLTGFQLYSPSADEEYYEGEFEAICFDDDGRDAWFIRDC